MVKYVNEHMSYNSGSQTGGQNKHLNKLLNILLTTIFFFFKEKGSCSLENSWIVTEKVQKDI